MISGVYKDGNQEKCIRKGFCVSGEVSDLRVFSWGMVNRMWLKVKGKVTAICDSDHSAKGMLTMHTPDRLSYLRWYVRVFL